MKLALTCVLTVSLLGSSLGCESTRSTRPSSGQQTSANLAKALKLAEQAEKQASRGEIEKAQKLYVRSLALEPDQHGVWNNLGVLLMATDNLIDANRAFARAASIEPRESRPYENMGLIWLRVEPREAVKHFEQALDINPGSIHAMRGLVQARQRSNAPATEAAIELITQALLYEREPVWRTYLENERSRLRAELTTKRRLAGELR